MFMIAPAAGYVGQWLQSFREFPPRMKPGSGPRFCLYIHHTDAEREYAYDRESHVGKLDKGLDEAAAKGWTVVSMKDDWKTIFLAKP